MTATATKKPAHRRPDTSAKAIAERRELHRAAMHDSMLEGGYANADTANMFEAWITGALTTAELNQQLDEAVRKRLAK